MLLLKHLERLFPFGDGQFDGCQGLKLDKPSGHQVKRCAPAVVARTQRAGEMKLFVAYLLDIKFNFPAGQPDLGEPAALLDDIEGGVDGELVA